MAHDKDAGEEIGRPVIATNVVEAVVAAILLLVGIVVVVESRKLGAGWTSDEIGRASCRERV